MVYQPMILLINRIMKPLMSLLIHYPSDYRCLMSAWRKTDETPRWRFSCRDLYRFCKHIYRKEGMYSHVYIYTVDIQPKIHSGHSPSEITPFQLSQRVANVAFEFLTTDVKIGEGHE